MRGFLARWTALTLLVAAAGVAGGLAIVTSVRAHRAATSGPAPVIVPDHSSNWVGYVFVAKHVTGVRAEWVEPDVLASHLSGRTYQPTGPEAESGWVSAVAASPRPSCRLVLRCTSAGRTPLMTRGTNAGRWTRIRSTPDSLS